MLTDKQEQALIKACALYEQAHKNKQNKNTAQYLQLLNDALGELIEYIDEVDDIYYRVVFANCVDQLQEDGNIEFDDVILDAKASFYIQAVIWFADENTKAFRSDFTAHLFYAFTALGRMYLRGEHGVKQSDEAAYACYSCVPNLNNPAMTKFVQTAYLSHFVKNETTGEIIFTGNKAFL